MDGGAYYMFNMFAVMPAPAYFVSDSIPKEHSHLDNMADSLQHTHSVTDSNSRAHLLSGNMDGTLVSTN